MAHLYLIGSLPISVHTESVLSLRAKLRTYDISGHADCKIKQFLCADEYIDAKSTQPLILDLMMGSGLGLKTKESETPQYDLSSNISRLHDFYRHSRNYLTVALSHA